MQKLSYKKNGNPLLKLSPIGCSLKSREMLLNVKMKHLELRAFILISIET